MGAQPSRDADHPEGSTSEAASRSSREADAMSKSKELGSQGAAYTPLRKHKELFDTSQGWKDEWFVPEFLEAMKTDTDAAWSKVIEELLPGRAYCCNMFTLDFCDMLMEEVDNFAATGLPARRPNSMNNYGIILNEIGWKPMVNQLQQMVLAKVSERFWPHIAPLDNHHTFIVRYKENEDLGLDMHTDDSDITFNVCLGREFTGAPLTFCGIMGDSDHRKCSYTFHHKRGGCVFHLGRLRHGAGDIVSGERLNLIVWNHSSKYRKSEEYTDPDYVKEEGPPDAVCLSYTHDRDYGVFKTYDEKTADHEGRGWCPPRQFEYDNFKAERQVKRPARGGCPH
eukprot:TRINITY_DN43443_c0_g1_i1.p1 TRINITY_DN43443_c0_g1~~TRINITY_DN43443_c0_g1_i1.p1  ORF type:complete len:339 (+),score=68.27 TRINITY_DN43443_c0_g1_i1:54-1070(+)